MKQKTNKKNQPKQYFEQVPRKAVYGFLIAFALAAVLLLLLVPHFKPLQVASYQQIQDAHHDIIKAYFVSSTTCKNDVEDETARVKEFNHYFKVNQYANRAIIRGCNDGDMMLAKDDNGKWQRTNVNIILNFRQNPEWQKACLIDDITTVDTKVHPENRSIDAFNLQICDSLSKENYIHAWFAR
jgi:hypothetical protein